MKRAMIGLALVAVLAVIPAASVSAKEQKPLNFKMELTLFAEDCVVPHAPPFLTWAGTVVIDVTTYGWADFPTSPFVAGPAIQGHRAVAYRCSVNGTR